MFLARARARANRGKSVQGIEKTRSVDFSVDRDKMIVSRVVSLTRVGRLDTFS